MVTTIGNTSRAVRKDQDANWYGDRKHTTVWEIAGVNYSDAEEGEEDEHTTRAIQKPVECMRRSMLNHTKEGDVVYDP